MEAVQDKLGVLVHIQFHYFSLTLATLMQEKMRVKEEIEYTY